LVHKEAGLELSDEFLWSHSVSFGDGRHSIKEIRRTSQHLRVYLGFVINAQTLEEALVINSVYGVRQVMLSDRRSSISSDQLVYRELVVESRNTLS